MSQVKQEREQKWRKIYQEYVGSGLGLKAFSEEQGINHYTFKVWAKRFKAESGAQFKELSLVGGGGTYVVVLRNGRELKLSGSFNEARVRQLIGVCESC